MSNVSLKSPKNLQKWHVGIHTPFSGRMEKTLKFAVNYGMYVTQFFMGNPKTFKRTAITYDDLEECKKILKRFPIAVFTHFPYIANLAGSVKSLAWSGNYAQDGKTKAILHSIEYETNTLAKLKTRCGVVIHPGSYPDRKQGIKAIGESIGRIKFDSVFSMLLLENSSGQGTTLAKDFEEMKEIYDSIPEEKQAHVGFCIDTCHIYACGKYDLSKVSEIDRMFEDFDRILGLCSFWLLHLNDSKAPFGSKKDLHASLGKGQIWGKSFDSLIHLLKKCHEEDIPCVLETGNMDDLEIIAGFA